MDYGSALEFYQDSGNISSQQFWGDIVDVLLQSSFYLNVKANKNYSSLSISLITAYGLQHGPEGTAQ